MLHFVVTAGYGSVLLNKARQVEACSLSDVLEFPLVLGRDFTGHVVSKGHGVGNHLKVGDEVWGSMPPHQQGSHAQFVKVNKCFVSWFVFQYLLKIAKMWANPPCMLMLGRK